jgi:hypothetical protein
LLAIDGMDDTLMDCNGKTAHDVCMDAPTAEIFSCNKDIFVKEFFQKTAALISEQEVDMLRLHQAFTNTQRTRSYLALGWNDLNAAVDNKNELSLLHLVFLNLT